jgi:hypothetical protein
MPGIKPFVEAGYDTRIHDLQVDRAGLQRDSTGWTVKAGSTFAFYRLLTGEIAIGYIQRDYVDPTLQPLRGPSLDASLIYAFSALTNVKLIASTVASETTVLGDFADRRFTQRAVGPRSTATTVLDAAGMRENDVAGLALLCSTRLEMISTLAICSAFFMLGLMSDYLFGTRAKAGSWWASAVYSVLPNWQLFWMGDALEEGKAIPWSYVGSAFGYVVAYVGAALAAALCLFEDRELA